jgi:tetratricopeptide (TPR) repeat protein
MLALLLAVALAAAEDSPETAAVEAPAEVLPEVTPPTTVAEPEPAPASGEELLEEAWRRVDEGDWEGARIVAELALTREPEVHDRARAALGASWELEGKPERAIPLYEQVLSATQNAELQDHMRLRIAECYGQLGQPVEALRRLEALEASHEWMLVDQLKIDLLRGVWLLESGERKPGLKALKVALRDAPPDEVAFYQAKARATLARVLCEDAAALPLDGSEKKAKKNIEKRAELIATAEKQVVGAIQLQEPEWALDGLLTLGRAYERIGDDMLAMPVPKSIDTPERRQMYDELLNDRVEVLYVKATKYYEKGLDLAVRLSWRSRRIAMLEDALGAATAKVDRLAAPAPQQEQQQP